MITPFKFKIEAKKSNVIIFIIVTNIVILMYFLLLLFVNIVCSNANEKTIKTGRINENLNNPLIVLEILKKGIMCVEKIKSSKQKITTKTNSSNTYFFQNDKASFLDSLILKHNLGKKYFK